MIPILILYEYNLQLILKVLSAFESKTAVPFIISHKDQVVGTSRYFDMSEQHKHLEIGFTWFNPSVWRTIVNTETKYLMLRHAFEDMDCIRVQLKTDLRNVRSQEAMRRLGATQEGILRHVVILPDGHLRNTMYFSILREEWFNKVKPFLESKIAKQ